MYKIILDTSKKLFIIAVSGVVDKTEGEKLYQDVIKNIKSTKSYEYSLICETSELEASTQDSILAMEKLMELYLSTPFRKRYCLTSKDIIKNIRLKKIGQDSFVDGFIAISSIDEIK